MRQQQHPHGPTSDTTDDDDALFTELLAGVAQSYAEVDAVFASAGPHNVTEVEEEEEPTTSDAHVRTDGAGGMFLEFSATKVIPFGVHATGAAVWHHFVHAKERTPARFYSNKSHKVRAYRLV